MKKQMNEFTIVVKEGEKITPELIESQTGIAEMSEYGDDLGEPDSELEVMIKIETE